MKVAVGMPYIEEYSGQERNGYSLPVHPNSNPTEDTEEDIEIPIWKPRYTVELPESGIDVLLGGGWGAVRSRKEQTSAAVFYSNKLCDTRLEGHVDDDDKFAVYFCSLT
jgi:hypothetical protein